MSSDPFLDKKDLKKLDRQLQQLISRTGSDRKTEDEVFDKSTLSVIEKLISNGILEILDFPISTGKEGNVFRGVTPDNKLVAVKIYRTSTSSFKRISQYIVGDPRFQSFHHTRRGLIFAWTKKEFKNLERVKRIGIMAPKPIISIKNVLVMEYIGSKSNPAPLLKDTEIDNPEEIFEVLINYISDMYKKAKMVHADFSAYNVLIHEKKPYLIDFGQGVLLDHPSSDEFLRRDINNIVKYFKKYNLKNSSHDIYLKIIDKAKK